MNYLEKHYQNILYFNLDDIIVINYDKFLFINADKIYDINNGFYYITTPISIEGDFVPPELKKKNLSLPLEVYYTSSYYSLALLLSYCLYGKHIRFNNKYDDSSEEHYLPFFNSIYSTKLFYFCQRCLKEDPKKRIFLYT